MKKFTFLIILTFAIFSSVIASTSSVGIGVGVEITFGRHYPNCDGRGICHLKVDIDVSLSASSSTVYLDESTRTLEISTTQVSLMKNQPDKIKDFQGKSSYNFIEDWAAPEELNKALKASKPIVIKAGTYPLSFKDGKYIIKVKL